MDRLGDLGRYRPGTAPLYRMLSPVKLAIVIICMVSTFFVNLGLSALVGLLAVVVLCAFANVSPWDLFLSALPLVIGLVIVAALNIFITQEGPVLFQWGAITITEGGLSTAFVFAWRLILLVGFGLLLLMTTTPTDLTDGFSRLFGFLKPLGVPVEELALVMSLALRYVPTLAEEVGNVRDAQTARGGALTEGGVGGRLRALGALVVPVIAAAIRHADNLSRALQARAWESGAPRTHWKRRAVRPIEVVALLGTFGYLTAMILIP